MRVLCSGVELAPGSVMPVTSRTATGGSSDPPEQAVKATAVTTIRVLRRIDHRVSVIGRSQQADEIENFGP